MDDYEPDLCSQKHFGPVVYVEGKTIIMRCSFCEQLFTATNTNSDATKKPRSSKTCVSDCDWITDDKTVTCRSCSYTGPLPSNFVAKKCESTNIVSFD